MSVESKDQMKKYWQNGDRANAFTLYLIESDPNGWMRHANKLNGIFPRLEFIQSIDEFKGIAQEMFSS